MFPNGWKICHCIYILCLFYPFICLQTHNFLILGYCEQYCSEHGIQIILHDPVFISSGYIPNPLGLLDQVVVLFLSFWGTSILFCTIFVLISISNKQWRRVLFLHIWSWVASACSSLKQDFGFRARDWSLAHSGESPDTSPLAAASGNACQLCRSEFPQKDGKQWDKVFTQRQKSTCELAHMGSFRESSALW